MSAWYCVPSEGQHIGPISVQDLRALLSERPDMRHALVWTEGLDDWQTVAQVKHLILPRWTAAYSAVQKRYNRRA